MPTTAQVNTAASNFIADTNTADAKINGPIADVTDRHGTTTPSLEKVLASIAYEPPITFTSGLAMTTGRQTVIYNGFLYAANPASVPFTTTATFNSTQWLSASPNKVYASRAQVEASSIPAQVDSLSYIHDGMLLTAFRDLTGVALTAGDGSKWSPKGPTVCFQEYGATSNSTADQFAYVSAAIGSGLPIVNRRSDRFRVKTALNEVVTDGLFWVGGILEIELSAPGNNLLTRTATSSDVVPISIYDVQVLTLNSNCANGLWIDFSPNLTPGALDVARHYRALQMVNVHFGPYTYDDPTQYFSTACLTIEDVQAPYFADVTWSGPKVSGGEPVSGTSGLKVIGFSDPVRSEFVKCSWRALDKGVDVIDDVEGLTFDGGSFVDCVNGIHFVPDSTGYENLGIYALGVEFNCISNGAFLNAGAEIKFDTCTFRQHDDWKAWNGIQVGFNKAVRDLVVTNCSFSASAGTVNTSVAIKLGTDTNRAKIYGNSGNNINTFCDTSALITQKQINVYGNVWSDKAASEKFGVEDQVSNTAYVKLTPDGSPPNYGSKTVADLNALTGVRTGSTAYCRDEAGGQVPVFFDSVSWRRGTDRAVIS